MSKMRIVMFAVAIGSAVTAGLLAKGVIGKKPEPQQMAVAPKIETVDVLVAAKDIEMGERLAAGTVIWKSWPKNVIQEMMITKDEMPDAEEKLAESRALLPMFEGETILEKKVVNPGEGGFMSAVLPKGMRATSVAISNRSAAGGFILPHDRVDVILTRKISVADTGNTLVKSETVITNVRVLAINQVFKQAKEGEEPSLKDTDTATLEMSLEQAEIIARVETEGELSLALRSLAENDGNAMKDGPRLAEKYMPHGTNKIVNSDTLFVRYGIETYATSR
jgi:pilus assembly protein CpaB